MNFTTGKLLTRAAVLAAALALGGYGCSVSCGGHNESAEALRSVPVPLEVAAALPGAAASTPDENAIVRQSYTLSPDGQFTFNRSVEAEVGSIGATFFSVCLNQSAGAAVALEGFLEPPCLWNNIIAGNAGGDIAAVNPPGTAPIELPWSMLGILGEGVIAGTAAVVDPNFPVDREIPEARRGNPRLLPNSPGRPGSRAIDAGFGKPPCLDFFPFPVKQADIDFEGDPPYDDPGQENRGGGEPPYKDVGADEVRPKADGSLQDLIDQAQDGDEILFPPGSIEERITIVDKSLVIRAAVEDPQNPGVLVPGGHPFDHVIRAPADGLDQSVVTIDGGPTTRVLLEGFTVTGGRAPAGGR